MSDKPLTADEMTDLLGECVAVDENTVSCSFCDSELGEWDRASTPELNFSEYWRYISQGNHADDCRFKKLNEGAGGISITREWLESLGNE